MPTHSTTYPPTKAKPAPAKPVIQYWTKEHFGRRDRYIVDSPLAFAFKDLTGRSSLRDKDMDALAVFGYRFEEVSQASV